jgi:hypothetical protein
MSSTTQNDKFSGDGPDGDYQDNDYQMRQGQKGGPIPVTTGPAEDSIDPATADSDEILGRSMSPRFLRLSS